MEQIIKSLSNAKEYNANEHFLGINNSYVLRANSFHLHIIKKTEDFYSSIIDSRINFILISESRMTNALNINENLLAYPMYYKDLKEDKDIRILSSNKFNFI